VSGKLLGPVIGGTVTRRIGLGSVVGLVVAAICWRGNHADGLVSVFPDGMTFAALIVLLTAVNRVERRHLTALDSMWKAGLTVAGAAGVVFGLSVVWLGLLRFASPTLGLLAGTFMMACVAALGCGWVAVALSVQSSARGAT